MEISIIAKWIIAIIIFICVVIIIRIFSNKNSKKEEVKGEQGEQIEAETQTEVEADSDSLTYYHKIFDNLATESTDKLNRHIAFLDNTIYILEKNIPEYVQKSLIQEVNNYNIARNYHLKNDKDNPDKVWDNCYGEIHIIKQNSNKELFKLVNDGFKLLNNNINNLESMVNNEQTKKSDEVLFFLVAGIGDMFDTVGVLNSMVRDET